MAADLLTMCLGTYRVPAEHAYYPVPMDPISLGTSELGWCQSGGSLPWSLLLFLSLFSNM